MPVGVGVASDGAGSFEVRAKARNSWQAGQTGENQDGFAPKSYPHNKKRLTRSRSDMFALACHSGSGMSFRIGKVSPGKGVGVGSGINVDRLRYQELRSWCLEVRQPVSWLTHLRQALRVSVSHMPWGARIFHPIVELRNS